MTAGREVALARALDALCADGARLYAVLDGARDARIFPEVAAADLPASALYQGDLPPEVAAAAPWLVDLGRGPSPLRAWLLERGWGRSWGVFLVADADLKRVRKHLRTLLEVRTAAGRKLYFRWYDPRVLRDYLPTCTPAEQAQVFGPARALACEDDAPDALLVFRPVAEDAGADLDPEREGAALEVVALGGPAPGAPEAASTSAPPEAAPTSAPPSAGAPAGPDGGVPPDAGAPPDDPAAAACWALERAFPDAEARAAVAQDAGVAPGAAASAWAPAPWPALWATPAARLPLVRAALARRPGEPAWLRWLAEEAEAGGPALGQAAGALARGLGDLAGEGAPIPLVREALRALPPAPPALLFAALAPACAGVAAEVGARARDLARGGAGVLALAGRLRALRRELQAAQGAPDEAPRVAAGLEALRAIDAAAQALPAGHADLVTLRAGLHRVLTRLGLRRSSDARAAQTALGSLLISLDGGPLRAAPRPPGSGPGAPLDGRDGPDEDELAARADALAAALAAVGGRGTARRSRRVELEAGAEARA